MSQNKEVTLPFVRSHAFIIGINNYEYLTPLRTAINNAKGIAQRLEAQHGKRETLIPMVLFCSIRIKILVHGLSIGRKTKPYPLTRLMGLKIFIL